MGRGKRIMRWLKKHLTIGKKNRSKNSKKLQKSGTKDSPSKEALLGKNQVNTIGNTSSEESQSSRAAESTPDSLEVQRGESNISLPHSELETPEDHRGDDVSIGEYITDSHHMLNSIFKEFSDTGRERRPPLLPPIEEEYQNANLKLPRLPKLDITTSKKGNIAFEVTERPKTPKPARFSARPSSREPAMDRWAEKMDSAIQKKQNAIREIQDKCREESERVLAVRARKIFAHTKPLSHGTSLLSELPSTPDIATRPPSRGGVSFQVDHRPSVPSSLKEAHRADSTRQSEVRNISIL